MGVFSSLIDIVKQIEREKEMAFLDTVKRALNNGKIIIVAAEPDNPIEKLLVLHEKDNKLKSVVTTKKAVINSIQDSGRDFFTLNTEDIELTPVYVVDGQNGEYLRTDREQDEEEDNLGNLPSILFMKTIIKLRIA